MGCHIEPTDKSKLQWLIDNAVTVPRGLLDFDLVDPDGVLVCLVNNGTFHAAGVCFNKAEFEAFRNPRDARPKVWFIARRSKVREVSALALWEDEKR